MKVEEVGALEEPWGPGERWTFPEDEEQDADLRTHDSHNTKEAG